MSYGVPFLNIYFDWDKYILTPDSVFKLDNFIDKYLNSDFKSILIVGHADSEYSEDYSLRISEARANSTKEYLVRNGIADTAIKTIAVGKNCPAVEIPNGGRAAENRRVEVFIVG
jgi:outer membrane protein OmpA-like peptidoglycan-associated protein